MLNKKKFNIAIIGKSYLSIILAHDLLAKGHDSLLLLDERFDYGDITTSFFNDFEKEILFSWGCDKNIKPLIKINKYLRPHLIEFQIDDKLTLKLGHTSPYKNLWELSRKLPHLFTDLKGRFNFGMSFDDELAAEKFDTAYFSLIKRLGRNVYHYHDTHNLNIDVFYNLCPQIIMQVWENLNRVLKNDQALSAHNLNVNAAVLSLFLAKFAILKKVSLGGTQLENLYLLLSLLSPQYECEQSSLCDDLLIDYMQKGGVSKKGQVDQWQFEKGRPWCLELSDFEGIIRPKMVFLMGAIPYVGPFKFINKNSHLRSVVVDYTIDQEIVKKNSFTDDNRHFLYTSYAKVGTSNPIWYGKFCPSRLQFHMLFIPQLGQKAEFLKEDISKILHDDFFKKYPLLNSAKSDMQVSFGQDIMLHDQSLDYKTLGKNNHHLSKIEIGHQEFPGTDENLKDVTYFGPMKNSSFGIIGQLVEMKDLYIKNE